MTRDQLLHELTLERFGRPIRTDRPTTPAPEPDDEFTCARRRKDLETAAAEAKEGAA